jgi:hypothetical protein
MDLVFFHIEAILSLTNPAHAASHAQVQSLRTSFARPRGRAAF